VLEISAGQTQKTSVRIGNRAIIEF